MIGRCKHSHLINFDLFIEELSFFLISLTDLSEVDVNTFLGPFLDVIRSEDPTGPITGVALTSVNKFLSYGLIGELLKSRAFFINCSHLWSININSHFEITELTNKSLAKFPT